MNEFEKTGALLLLSVSLAFQGLSQEWFHSNDHFDFYRQDDRDYGEYVSAFSGAYDCYTDLLDLGKNHKIKIIIFSNQRNFIERVFGFYESKVTSVGMALEREETILITSYHDGNTGRDLDEYRRVARHELVHVLLPHPKAWLSEGLALFCAGQVRELEALPASPEEMGEYLNCNIFNREAYGYYSWFTRFLIQKAGFRQYVKFYKSDCNWGMVGYSGQDAFCRDAFDALIEASSEDGPLEETIRFPDSTQEIILKDSTDSRR